MIPAITTHYAGCRFRSRAEARWAIFFDAVALRYQYEFDGFLVREGAYLPDFWLPDVRMFFEVKGEEPTAEERSKCASLTEVSECDMLLAVGNPQERFQLYWFDREGEREDRYVLAQDKVADAGFWLVAEDHANPIGPNRSGMVPQGPMFSGALEAAYCLAGEARFERGERMRRVAPEPHRPDRTAAASRVEGAA